MSDSIIQTMRDGSSSCRASPVTNVLINSIHRSSSSATPLHRFVEVKNKINDTFHNIDDYISETAIFLKNLSSIYSPPNIEQILNNLNLYNESIRTIESVLARDKMKVVFFGRTSNGKSTVVNAMLHAKVLPSGMGHTTRCFLQVEASSSGDQYILTEESNEQKSWQSINALSNALCAKSMGEDALVRVMWPKNDSKLLKNEVVLVDSPGVDLSPQFDGWIDKHCLDADVFVLVCNAESTITQTEKNFFHRVKTKLAKPNLFILNNRWDASASEPEHMEQVREQHMKQFIKFYVDELGACSNEEAANRIFFVSAREMLQHRLRNRGLPTSPSSSFMEGHEARSLEFEEFERKFELCISQSAIDTKFERHIKNGEAIADSVYTILNKIQTDVEDKKTVAKNELENKSNSLSASVSSHDHFMCCAKNEIIRLSHLVQSQVSKEFSDELKRLEAVVDSYNKPFSDDPAYLSNYKQDIVSHVSGVITNDLQLRFTGGLLAAIIERERLMISEAAKILPSHYEPRVFGVMQYRQPFRFSFALHFPSLMEDFREDLKFKFFLSPFELIRRLTTFRSRSVVVESYENTLDSSAKSDLFGSRSLIPESMMTQSKDGGTLMSLTPQSSSSSSDILTPAIIYSTAAYMANGGVGLMLIGGLLFKAIGWRVLLGGMTLYGLLYLYERLNWNSRTKERLLKSQIREHLGGKLRQTAHSVAISCDDQVTKEVNEIFNRLQCFMNESQDELKAAVNECEKSVYEFDKLAKQFDKIKKRGIVLNSQLTEYLKEPTF